MKKRIILGCLVVVVIASLEVAAMLSKPKVNFVRDDSFSEPIKVSLKQESSFLVAEAAPILEEQAKAEEALKLELIGTAMGNLKDPSAFIKDLDSGKQGIYKLGSKIQEAKVVKITMGKVVLDVQGKEQVLTMSERGKSWARLDEEQPSMITLLGDHILVNKTRLVNEA